MFEVFVFFDVLFFDRSSHCMNVTEADFSIFALVLGVFEVFEGIQCPSPFLVDENEQSQDDCARLCLRLPRCIVFIQHDIGLQSMKGGCFLHDNTQLCRQTATKWVAAFRGMRSLLDSEMGRSIKKNPNIHHAYVNRRMDESID